MADPLLSGVTVVDLTHHVAGPYCTKLLALSGADVIKIERPRTGDPSRQAGPFPGDISHPEKSALFLYLNTGKHSVTLDLKRDEGRSLVERLVRDADIVVENFSPRVLPSLGLSYASLRRINPRLVVTSISNFGQTGPCCDYRATNLTLSAMSVGMSQQGAEDREPLKLGGRQVEYMGGVMALTATIGALFRRDIDGVGQRVDISLFEAAATNDEGSYVTYGYQGVLRTQKPNRHAWGHPAGIYPCRDGHLIVMPGYGNIESLALLVEQPELAEHPLFKDRYARQQRPQEFDALVLPWLKAHDKHDIVRRAQELRMPFSPVLTVGELFDDAQLASRQFFQAIEHPEAGDLAYPSGPFRLDKSFPPLRRAPLLGEHTEEVLGDRLGVTKRELARLRKQGIV
ncbi:MAG: CoA transferase [Chloroflexi bacterium]|nr:CoA transferase [Chloroflexota bacterium]